MPALNLLLAIVLLVLVANIQHTEAFVIVAVSDNGKASEFEMSTKQHTNLTRYNLGKI